MTFEFENLTAVVAFEAEYRPNERIKAGAGLMLELNQDIVTAEFLERSADALRKIIPDEKSGEAMTETVTEDKTSESENAEAAEKPEAVAQRLRASLASYDDSIRDVRFMARILGGKDGSSDINDRVIRKWNLVRSGAAVEVSFSELYSWKLTDLRNLYMFCLYEATGVKKKNANKSGRR